MLSKIILILAFLGIGLHIISPSQVTDTAAAIERPIQEDASLERIRNEVEELKMELKATKREQIKAEKNLSYLNKLLKKNKKVDTVFIVVEGKDSAVVDVLLPIADTTKQKRKRLQWVKDIFK